MKTIFVEDVPEHRIDIREELSKCTAIEVVGEADSIESAYDMILQKKPELVFLDIQLGRGTAFDLLDRLLAINKIDFEVIFITGWLQFDYAARCINYAALRLLTKPIEQDKLQEAVLLAAQKITQKRQYEILLQQLKSLPSQKNNTIVFHRTRGTKEFILIPDILYLEADEGVSKVFLANGNSFTAIKSVTFYSNLLVADYKFFRIHDKLLANLDYLLRYEHNDNYKLTFKNGISLNASRRYGKELKEHLGV